MKRIGVARVPDLLATFFAVIAWLCALLALVPLLRERTEPVRAATPYLAIPIRPNLAYAAFLGLLATSLRRRTRMSWWIVVLLYLGLAFVGSVIAGITEPALFLSALVLAILLALLVAARPEFTARLERGNGLRALLTLLGGLTVASGIGVLLVNAFPGTLGPVEDRVAWAVDHVVGGLGWARPLDVVGEPPAVVTFVCGALGGCVFLLAAWVLFRPAVRHTSLGPAQEAAIRELLAATGERDSLGYFATRRDKAAIFSPSGKAAVTYRVVFGTILASGDPIGDPEAWPPAIDAWLAEARAYAWTPAALGVSERGAMAYRRAGLSALQIGDEAIVETGEFTVSGRAMRGVRQAVHRVEKAGHTCRIRYFADLPAPDIATVRRQAAAWRDTEHERGFSMALGRVGDPGDERCVLVEALGPDGVLRAVLSFVPWGARGLSLDLMRRDPDADNGLVEFMVVKLVEASERLGIERISLNFAAFREVFEQGARIGAGPFIRLARSVLLFFSRWWQLESLYRSNAKYRPSWEPRLLCFRMSRDLPRIGVAAGLAEGLVSRPRLAPLFRRTRHRPNPRIEPGLRASPQAPGPEAPGLEAPGLEAPGLEAPGPAPAVPAARPVAPAGPPEQARRHTVEQLRAAGVDPYPVGFTPTATAADLHSAYSTLPPDTQTGARARVAGRLIVHREVGRVSFATVKDGTGRIQVMFGEERIGDDALARWRRLADIGDHIGVSGEVVTTKRGELTVSADEWTITAKSLRPWPVERHDEEYRCAVGGPGPVTDLTATDVLHQLHQRSRMLAGLRRYLGEHGFVEIDSPIPQPGRTGSRSFVVAGSDGWRSPRDAPGQTLRRLVVCGADRVFELGRIFQAQGAGAEEYGECSVLEAYQTYGDYSTALLLAREMIQRAAVSVHGSAVARREGADGVTGETNLSGEWRVTTVNSALSAALGRTIDNDTTMNTLTRICDAAKLSYSPQWCRGAIVLRMYEHFCRTQTEDFTFYRDFPSDIAPIAREHRVDRRVAERWELVAAGTTIGTGWTELTDPVEWRRRLATDTDSGAAATAPDDDVPSILEYGMPPTAGLSIVVDRLLMTLTGRRVATWPADQARR